MNKVRKPRKTDEQMYRDLGETVTLITGFVIVVVSALVVLGLGNWALATINGWIGI